MSTRDEVQRLATRVASMLSTTRPGQHQADLREIHAKLLRLAGVPARATAAWVDDVRRVAGAEAERWAVGADRAHLTPDEAERAVIRDAFRRIEVAARELSAAFAAWPDARPRDDA